MELISKETIPTLDNCTNQNLNIEIFDMDGTLYELDGVNNGYKGSTLEAKVLTNAVKFIQERQNCTDIEAQNILQMGLEDPIGMSSFIAKRYDISRKDYFENVWNIDPAGVIKNIDTALLYFQSSQNKQRRKILLTSAPKIWTDKVLLFLKIADYFDEIITGEHYTTKKEIFERMSQIYKPENILSIGDQLETDILPAQKYNIKTFQVTGPNDLP